MENQFAENMRIAQRVTIVGMILDIILGVGKILVGLISSSHAVVTDGIHSLSDVVTDIFVLFITRISNHEPDHEHPYGHARFEALGTILLGSTLILVALALAYDSIMLTFTSSNISTPTWPALLITLVSIFSKEWIFHYTRRAGEQLRSNILIANAWHSRTDVFSSVVVLVGVGGAMLGLTWLDAVAATIVALIIGKIGLSLVWDSMKELVDTGVPIEQTKAMEALITSSEGVRSIHNLRTRQMGADIFLDVHIHVSPDISVSEGHQVGEWVTQRLLKEFTSIRDMTYHIDVEDDRHTETNAGESLLPLRNVVIAELESSWKELTEFTALHKRYVLHYLDDKIDVEVFLESHSNATDQELNGLKSRLVELSSGIDWIRRIELWRSAG